jgi:glycosyltransferase involved in cell wall biosynthesis
VNTKPLTVVHLASGDLWAGAEVQLYLLAKELHREKHIRLFVVLLNHGILEDKLKDAGINVTVIDEQKLGHLQLFRKLFAYLRNISPDIVHTHRQKENIIGSLAALLCGSKRSFRTVHGAAEHRPGALQVGKRILRYLDWVTGRFLQDKIIAVSSDLSRQLVRRFPSRMVCVVENGIDAEGLRLHSAENVDLPGPAHATRIVFLGRLVPVKRIDIFLRIAHALVKQDPHKYAFYIFGVGPLLGEIERLRAELNLERHVFLMGFKPNVAAYLAKMNILLITSDHEGLPTNLLEALYLRIPVVARSVGGIPAVLDNGRCGALVHAEAPEGYVEAIRRYLSDTGRLAQLVENGYEQVTRHYLIENTGSRYCQLYFDSIPIG